jgi:hypothetical protein
MFEAEYLVAIRSLLTVMVSDKYIFARLSTESNLRKDLESSHTSPASSLAPAYRSVNTTVYEYTHHGNFHFRFVAN